MTHPASPPATTPDGQTTPDITDLTGAWFRRSITWPDGRSDTTTWVLWLQARTAFADIRLGTDGAAEGFAGHITLSQDASGTICTWHRSIDLKPAGLADIGRLMWRGPDRLQEDGVLAAYTEVWQRDAARTPTLVLRAEQALLVAVGRHVLRGTPAAIDYWQAGDDVLRRSTTASREGAAIAFRAEGTALEDHEGVLWHVSEAHAPGPVPPDPLAILNGAWP